MVARMSALDSAWDSQASCSMKAAGGVPSRNARTCVTYQK